jgi:hypothetical protein
MAKAPLVQRRPVGGGKTVPVVDPKTGKVYETDITKRGSKKQ